MAMSLTTGYCAQRDNASLALRLARCVRKAARQYAVSHRHALRRGAFLIRQLRFTPEEALGFGLFDPAFSEEALRRFVSKRALSALQNHLNPRSCYELTEDKGVFYRVCAAHGIPVPALYAIAYRGHPSWTREGTSPVGPAEWAAFVERLPREQGLTIKPCRALFAQGVNIFTRTAEGMFEGAVGEVHSAEALGRWLWEERLASGLIIQQRLYNHAAFDAISDTRYLQTLRVMTYVDRGGEPQILAVFLKLIRGDNHTDNFAWGRSGNCILRLDSETSAPLDVLEGEQGVVTRCSWEAFCANNPALQRSFRVPDWQQVRARVRELAEAFLPLRAIGWDIAITDDGPLVVEGNYRAGAYPFAGLRELLAPMFEESAVG